MSQNILWDILKKKQNSELRTIARKIGFNGISKLNKKQLIELILTKPRKAKKIINPNFWDKHKNKAPYLAICIGLFFGIRSCVVGEKLPYEKSILERFGTCTPFHKKGCYLDMPYSGYTSTVKTSPNSGIIGTESKAIFFYNQKGAELNVVTFSRDTDSKEKYKYKSFPLNSSPFLMTIDDNKLYFKGSLYNLENKHLGNFDGEKYNVKEFEGNCAYTVCEDRSGIEIVTMDNEVIFSVSTKDEYCDFMGYYKIDKEYYVYYKPNEYFITKDILEAKKYARLIKRKFDHSNYSGTKCKRVNVN